MNGDMIAALFQKMGNVQIFSVVRSFLLLILQLFFLVCVNIYEWMVPPDQKSLREKIILITGGGGSLAREMAKQLSLMGTQVVLCDIDEAELQETGRIVQEHGGEVVLYRCDVSKRDQVNEMATKVRLEVGEPWLIINCAHLKHRQHFLQHSGGDIQNTTAVNVLGAMWVTQAFLPAMASSNSGHVVFLCPLLSVTGWTLFAPYCASQSAIVGFCEALGHELEEQNIDGIALTTVHPLLTDVAADMPQLDTGTRLSGLLKPPSLTVTAAAIIDGIRRNKHEIFLPGFLKPIIKINRSLPRRIRSECQKFVERTTGQT